MNILEQAIDCHSMDNACALIQGALGITDGDIAGYSMPQPKYWPGMDRVQRCNALAEWIANEFRYAVSDEEAAR